MLLGKLNEKEKREGTEITSAAPGAPGAPTACIKIEKVKKSIYGIDFAWSLGYFTTCEGSEYFHIYLWVLKDLSWTQNQFELAMFFGGFAILWCPLLLFNAIKNKRNLEIVMLVPTFLWLVGNFIWMTGETSTQDDAVVVPISSYFLFTAVSFLLLYYCILRPLNVIPIEGNLHQLEHTQMEPRYPVNLYFKNWRDYEHIHMLFWVCKDLSWNQGWIGFWWFSTMMTLLVSIDFIVTSFSNENCSIDFFHYTALMLWVAANATWAYGDLIYEFDGDDTYAKSIFTTQYDETIEHLRWWSSWILFVNSMMLLIFNMVWIKVSFQLVDDYWQGNHWFHHTDHEAMEEMEASFQTKSPLSAAHDLEKDIDVTSTKKTKKKAEKSLKSSTQLNEYWANDDGL